MVDVHCHLADERLERDLDGVVKRAKEKGVTIISCGTDIKSSTRTVEIAEKFKNVWACTGVHPEEIREIQDMREEVREGLRNLLGNKKVVGVGETGLDYFQGISEEDKEKQKKLFEIHLQLAEEFGLPVQVHNRGADEDILNMVSRYKVQGVMHCFTRGQEFIERCTNAGWYISFGGLITYNHNQKMRRVAIIVPEKGLLLETDAPYSVPKPDVATVNEPEKVWITAEAVAKLRGVSAESLDILTSQNARNLFSKIKV
jgi:TatD DNase family protein